MGFKHVFVFLLVIFSFSCVPNMHSSNLSIKSTPSFYKKEKRNYDTPNKTTSEILEFKDKGFIILQTSNNTNNSGVVWTGYLEKKIRLILKQIRQNKVRRSKLKIELNNVSVEDFINAIFGQIFKINYEIDPSVKRIHATINISFEKPVSTKKFIEISLRILERYGVYPFWDPEREIVVFKFSKETKFVNVPIFVNTIPQNLPDDKIICLFYNTKYVDLNKYFNFITKYITGNYARLELLNNGETIVSVSTVEVNRKLLTFLKYVDKPLFRRKTIALLSLEYLEPKDFISKIITIMDSLQIKVSDKLPSADVFLYLIGSNVIVICKNNNYCKIIKEWKDKIDNINSISWNGFYVYIPKNRNASDLVKILQNIRKTKSANFEVILDESRNQIILKGKKSVLAPVIALLKKLDTLPKQVLVETIIAEITLKNELQYGLEWFLQHSGYFNGSLGTLNGLGVGGAGFSYSLVTSTGKFKLIMNMFAKKNLIKILSSPHLVVINGKQASINVGTEVPVISSEVSAADVTTSTNKPSILRNVSYRNTGVQLNIKPFILSKGVVELEVKQTISEAQANNLSSIDSPIILNRSISTDVIVKNGESVVLGGLISSNYSKTVNKVPGLGDIPAIGNLFKSDSTGRTKTELVLIITPKILTSTNDYVSISNSIINGLQEINAMLQNQ